MHSKLMLFKIKLYVTEEDVVTMYENVSLL